MGGIGGVTVVVLNDLVEEFVEDLVGAVGASVAANAGVDVLATRENAGSERHTHIVTGVLVLFPVILGEEAGNRGLLVGLREERVVLDVLGLLEPGTAVCASFDNSRNLKSGTTGVSSR
jgi:hypothetical protein